MMGWHEFRYTFDKQVQNAMRYSIEEAVRNCAHTIAMENEGRQIAQEAVESFKRKMEKHTGRPVP
jgi:hypothetical protein